jgi:hypothetical protein
MNEPLDPPGFSDDSAEAAGALTNSDFPDEPFECPSCGQLLAPSCRVCVACKQPVDPAALRKSQPVDVPLPLPEAEPQLPPVRFSWSVFFYVLGASWLVSAVTIRFLGLVDGQVVLSSLQLLSAIWVFFDARQKAIPKPLRWGVGSVILWIVIFPWYLVRRRTPKAPCPFVEADSGPFVRVMLLVIFIFFLVAVIVSLVGGPAIK